MKHRPFQAVSLVIALAACGTDHNTAIDTRAAEGGTESSAGAAGAQAGDGDSGQGGSTNRGGAGAVQGGKSGKSGEGGELARGGSASGGHAEGGAATRGGAANGGASKGGASSGGASKGGASSGGASKGGASSGGASKGGASSGGASEGGASSGGASESGGNAGAAGATCPIVPPCNWCDGEPQLDADGCTTGWLCENGKNPCSASPCGTGSGDVQCEDDEFCSDQLCWPLSGSGGASGAGGASAVGGNGGAGGGTECPNVLAWCNWCDGGKLLDSEGCPTQWICDNGVDPCVTSRCTTNEDCASDEEECREDGLCWPKIASCKDPVLTAQYPACNATQSEETCVALGGFWASAGGGPDSRCVCPTGDGECSCTDSTQCTTLCVADVDAAVCEQATEGTCADNSGVGCVCHVLDGTASLMCID